MNYRDLTTTIALLLVLLIAGTARSETDVLRILSGDNPVVNNVMGDGLGEDLDRAAAELRSTHGSPKQVEGTTRGQEHHSSLGIGAIGQGMLEPQGLPPIYARSGELMKVESLEGPTRLRAEAVLAGITQSVARCYGDPKRDGSTRTDSLAVQVVVDADGRVVVARVVRPTRLGGRYTDACVTRVLQQVRFAPGLTETHAQVGYRWQFDLGASTRLVFSPPVDK